MVDLQAFEKFENTFFFQDIQNSFQWVIRIGLEPNQKFFQKNSNKYGR